MNFYTEEVKESKLYKLYDMQDESDSYVMSLDEMRHWLAELWDNNPDEDMEEEEQEELREEILSSDKDELRERLAGVGYSFEEL